MFTVKHIERDGREQLISVESVSFDREANCLQGFGSSAADVTRWTSGHAYVMNEQGKTVAVYNISMNVNKAAVTTEQIEQAQGRARTAMK